MKRQITKAIKDGIETGLGVVDDQLVAVKARLDDARNQTTVNEDGVEEKRGTMSALQDVFKRSKSKEGSSSASETGTIHSAPSSHSQFKVVSNKRNSILANKGHPSGWVNRAVDKQEFKGETNQAPTDYGVAGGDKGWKTDA